MHVVVTGAAGFLGGCVVRRLVEEGHDVAGLVRTDAQAAFVRSLGAAPRRGDVTDEGAMQETLAGAAAVVHCAAKVGARGRREDFLQVNAGGTEAVARAAAARGCAMLHVSTVRVFGLDPPAGADEDAPYAATGDPYGDSKLEAERRLIAVARERGLGVTILRPGYVYGPRDRHLVPAVLEALRDGRLRYAGDGENRFDPLYGPDVAAAIAALVRRGPDGCTSYNLTSPEPITARRFVEALCARAGWPPPARSISREAAARAKQSFDLGAGHHPVVFDLMLIDRALDLGRIRRALGPVRWTPLEEGLDQAIAWCRAEGVLPARGGRGPSR